MALVFFCTSFTFCPLLDSKNLEIEPDHNGQFNVSLGSLLLFQAAAIIWPTPNVVSIEPRCEILCHLKHNQGFPYILKRTHTFPFNISQINYVFLLAVTVIFHSSQSLLELSVSLNEIIINQLIAQYFQNATMMIQRCWREWQSGWREYSAVH